MRLSYSIPHPYALDAVCNPQTYEKINALATGLYYQSGGYNCDLHKHELKYDMWCSYLLQYRLLLSITSEFNIRCFKLNRIVVHLYLPISHQSVNCILNGIGEVADIALVRAKAKDEVKNRPRT